MQKMFLVAFFKFRVVAHSNNIQISISALLLVFQVSVFMTETSYSLNTTLLMSHNSQY